MKNNVKTEELGRLTKNHYKFLIPVRPDSVNKVCTYGKKDGDVLKLKHKWEEIAIGYIRRAMDCGELPDHFQGRIGVHFKLFFELNRERDGDNYAFMCKGILDAFVKERMIHDDNHKYVDDNGRRLRIDKDQPRVEVHITEYINNDNIVSIDYGETGTDNSHRSNIGNC